MVVGGGHNGLVCAAYLGRAGSRVLVLERRHIDIQIVGEGISTLDEGFREFEQGEISSSLLPATT